MALIDSMGTLQMMNLDDERVHLTVADDTMQQEVLDLKKDTLSLSIQSVKGK